MNPPITSDVNKRRLTFAVWLFSVLALLGALPWDDWPSVVPEYVRGDGCADWLITLETMGLFGCRWQRVGAVI